MEIILLRDERHLGHRGEVKKVKSGYARNFLIPQGFALEATPGNRKFFEEQRSKIDASHMREREAAAEVAAQLAAVRLVVRKKVGETETLYGSVTASELADELMKKGFEVDRRKIDLAGGIKSLGDHLVRIDLHSEVIAEVTVTVEADQS
jgi:large subunit ribosomal protein L9